MKRTFLCVILAAWLLAACSPVSTSTPTPNPPTVTLTPFPTDTLTPTLTASPTSTATPEPTATQTPSPTATASPTPVPTYVKLRGQVNQPHVVCHYGPGQPYLYKYGLVGGSNLEIIRRVVPGTYIEVQAIGGNNPCWVNPEWMDIKGNITDLQPVAPEDVKLPFTPYYSNYLTGVSARRDGHQVTVGWEPFYLRPGDDSEQYSYLVEAWVCIGGEIVFQPVGTYDTTLTFADEPGCDEPSHARAYAVEKHGYTKWVQVPWPPAE
jgi:hypothetical protein